MPLTGPFHIGKNVIVLGIQNQTVGSDGTTLTAGTTKSLLGVWETKSVNYITRKENIKSSSSGIDNNIVISDGFELELGTIILANGASALEASYLAADYFIVTLQSAPGLNGTGTAGQLKSYFASRVSLNMVYGEGKATATMRLDTAGQAPTLT